MRESKPSDQNGAALDRSIDATSVDGVATGKPRTLSSITSGYVFSGVLSRLLAMVAIPIIVANVSPADFGIYGVVQALVPAAAIVLGLGLGDALPIYYYEPGERDAKTQKLDTIVLCSFLIASVLVVAAPAVLLVFDDASSIIVSETLVLVAATILIRVYEPLRRSEERAGSIVVSRIAAGAVFFIGSSIAVTLLGVGAEGILGAFLAGEAVRALILAGNNPSLPLARGGLRSVRGLPRLLPFSVPLVLHSGSVFLLGYADRWLVAAMLSLAAAGVYTLSYQIASVLLMITASFNEAVSPRLYAAYQRGGREALVQWHKKTAPTYFLLSAVSAALLAGAGTLYVVFIAPPAYRGALVPLLIVLGGLVFQTVYTPHVNALLAIKRSREVATRSLSYTLLNLLLNIMLIPLIGLTGAALATLIAFGARYYSFARLTRSELGLRATLADLRDSTRDLATRALVRLRPRAG